MTARYPRPDVLARIPLDRHAVIEASAGTGKTFTIEHLVVELLISTSATLDQILVLTFTEKATAELKKRIRALLGRILTGCRDDLPAAGSWEIEAGARAKLEAALLAFDTASIHTIHGFFQRVLTSNAFPIGRPLEQEMVDGRTAFARAFGSALRARVAVDPGLSRHLAAWLEDEERPLTDLEELAWKCLPYHRRGTTFYPEYRPDELAQSLGSMLLPAVPSPEQLKSEMPSLRLQTARAITERLATLTRSMASFRTTGDMLALQSELHETVKYSKMSGPLLEIVQFMLARRAPDSDTAQSWLAVVEELLAGSVTVSSAVIQALMPAVVAQLDSDRSVRGQFDFDDMIRLVWEALQGPGAEVLAASLRARYRYALIDEFQDTDDVQWKIFERLFFRETGHVCYLVGDPKQSIYAFRGADVHAYIDATRNVESKSGAPAVPLDRSFRSTPALLAALDGLFRQDAAAPFFTDPAIPYRRTIAAGRPQLALTATAGAPAAPLVVLEVPPRGSRQSASGLKRALARTIAADIAAVLEGGDGDPGPGALFLGEGGERRRVHASDIFVLTRSGNEGRTIGEALREAGVPHAFYKQDGLFQTPEAADVRDVLMAIADPGDRSRRSKAWLTPFFDVPIAALPALAELPHTHPLIARLEEWYDLARRREPERLFASLADDSGLVRRLLEAGAERELTNYLHLFEILLAAAQHGARLPELIVELSAYIAGERLPPGEDAGVQRLESDRAAVQIMTMHKSKGLEADLVYVFGGFTTPPPRGLEPVVFHQGGARVLHLGRAAAAVAARDHELAHEHQRLEYVALTRARGRVVLPLLPAGEVTGLETSPYAGVNRRLTEMLAGGLDSSFCEVRTVSAAAGAALLPGRERDIPEQLIWPPAPDTGPVWREMNALKKRHEPLEMTSYSRIKRAHGGYVSPLDLDAFRGEAGDTDPLASPEVEPDTVPGGVAMGILLHEVIEALPLASLGGALGATEWAALPEVAAVLAETLARHGVSTTLGPAVARLVHRSLSAPVALGSGVLPGLATVAACAREMEFVFPYPEAAHPELAAAFGEPLEVGKGYVQGVIDLVFEREGRYFFADWKTDLLPDYGDRAVRAHVERNYRLQAQLYSLAMIKMLAIHDAAGYEARFGGLLYCFLRGMRSEAGAPSPGVYFERPGWDELVDFDRRLRTGGELG